MTRLTKSDSDTTAHTGSSTPDQPTPVDTRDTQASATAPTATAADTSSPYEPYPSGGFFHGGRHSPIISAMADRLVAEGHWVDLTAPNPQNPGPDWTVGHKKAFASYQRSLRPKEGGDVTGIPDEVAWDRLQVPRVSPVTKPVS